MVGHVRYAELVQRVSLAGGGEPVELFNGQLVLMHAHVDLLVVFLAAMVALVRRDFDEGHGAPEHDAKA